MTQLTHLQHDARYDMIYAAFHVSYMPNMTNLISFFVFYYIIELLSVFVVMINISKIKKTIILEIPSQIFFLPIIFVYQLNCSLSIPWYRLFNKFSFIFIQPQCCATSMLIWTMSLNQLIAIFCFWQPFKSLFLLCQHLK